jgi:HEAT repeat protein
MLALVNIVQTTTSAKRFNHLAGADALYRALRSNDEQKMSAAARAIGAISSRTDSAVSTIFAEVRKSFLANSCYQYLLNILEQQRSRGDALVSDVMQVFSAFCHPSTVLDQEFMDSAFKIIMARGREEQCSHLVVLRSLTVCSTLSKYVSIFQKDERKWLVTNIQKCLVSEKITDKTNACRALSGIWWDKECTNLIVKRPADLLIVYEMLNDARTRPEAAGAAAGVVQALATADPMSATEIAERGCTVNIYILLQSPSAVDATQAAKTMLAMCKQPTSMPAVLAEVPSLKKKEGIAPVISAIDRHDTPELKVACATCVEEVARLQQWTLKMAEQASPPLIRMLQNTNEEVVLCASRVLASLAKSESTHSVLRREGAVVTLNALLTDSSERVRAAGCLALKHLCREQESNDIMLRIGTAKILLDIMRKDTFFMVCRAGETMRTMLHLPNAQAEFLGLGGVDVLLVLLDSQEHDVRKIPGHILAKVLLNPRNKASFKNSKCFFKCLEVLAKDTDTNVRRTVCEALAILAGNDANVNIEYKTALYEGGFIESLRALLHDTSPGSVGVKARTVAAKSLSTMCSVMAVQHDIQKMGLLDVLVQLLHSTAAQQVIAIADVIARAVRYHIPNRRAASHAGLVKALAACMKWGGDATAAKSKLPASKKHEKLRIGVCASAADALSALLECPNCRRTYQGTRSVEVCVQGNSLEMPSVVNIYDCPHREVCLACGTDAAEYKVLDIVLDMLQSEESLLRRSAAKLLGSLAIGAPYHGKCELSASVCQQALEKGALKPLFKMLCAKDAFDVGRAAAEQFSAARAIDSLAARDSMRYAFCKMGFINALVEMLFSTLGRVKGSAALALSRLCATEDLHFYYNTQTEKTYWDKPDELIYIFKPDGTREYFEPEDIERDVVRMGYWVRGVFKPIQRIDFCDMLVETAQIKFGHGCGMHKMKADTRIVTEQPVLDLILDIFKSPIYDYEVNGWAAESCAIVSEFSLNRTHIAKSGCLPDIVGLLYSDNDIWKEQAAIGLSILMYDQEAKEMAGGAGVMQGLTEILLSPYSTSSLKESAALAVAKACWNASNQVVGLYSGAVMPLIAMLVMSDIRQWCCAVEALMAMSNNNECRSAIGKAGAIPALVNKLTLDGVEGETPAQVRVLLALTNVLSVPTNCDMAVDCGLMMRFIELTQSNDVLLLNFLLIAMSTVLKCERHMQRFVDCGLVQKLLILIGRYAIATEAGRQPGVPLIRIMLGRMMRCVCVCV